MLAQVCIWRFVLGIGIGGDYPLSASIASEYASTKWRGAFVGSVFAAQARLAPCRRSRGVPAWAVWAACLPPSACGALPALAGPACTGSCAATAVHQSAHGVARICDIPCVRGKLLTRGRPMRREARIAQCAHGCTRGLCVERCGACTHAVTVVVVSVRSVM